MNTAFRHVALIGKYQNPAITSGQAALGGIARLLQSQGCQVAVEAQTAADESLRGFPVLTLEAIARECDVGVVVGGDGTMLGVGRKLAASKVPLIGVNHGRVGFVTDIPFDGVEDLLPPMLRGEFEEDERSIMHAQVLRGDDCIYDALAMNDVVVHRGNSSGMVELRVEVDGRFVANQRADGLIIATSTGSTAYALSAGGPILHPAIAGWVLSPIAPHTLSNRPVVLSSDSEVTLVFVGGRAATVNFDMQTLTALQHGDRIHVRRAEHTVRFLHPRGWSYFDTLRKKLHWNEGSI